MKEKMTSRERLLAAIARKPVDYVPCSPFFNPLTPQQRVSAGRLTAGHSWQFPFGPSEQEMAQYCSNELGVDPVVALPIGNYYPNFFMSYYYCPDKNVSSKAWADRDTIHKVWITPAGELHAVVRYNEKWPHGLDIPFFSDFNIGHYIEPWLKSVSDMDCLRYILRPIETTEQLERVRFMCAEKKAFADKLQLPTIAHIGAGLTGAQLLCGAEKLCMLMLDQPELIESYLELEHKINVRHMEIACEMDADIIRRNGFYETSDFYSPKMLEQFLKKRLCDEIDTVHQAGKLIGYTVNTGVMPMLDYLSTLDFDCLLHIDMAFEGVDLSKIREKLGDRKSFWMGPSSAYHMWDEDSETPRKAVRKLFNVLGKKGLIITTSPSSHSIMPWNNTLAMIDEWKKLR